MKRRSFLTAVSGALGGWVVSGPAVHAQTATATLKAPATKDDKGLIPRRTLGRTGQKVSIIGYSGLVLVKHEQQACTESLHRSFDQGLNYFDVAPAYGDGVAETKMGVGLQGLDRDKIFLACKTKARDAAGARKELEKSLTLLQTDHFNLYQMHCLRTRQEVRQVLGPAGPWRRY